MLGERISSSKWVLYVEEKTIFQVIEPMRSLDPFSQNWEKGGEWSEAE